MEVDQRAERMSVYTVHSLSKVIVSMTFFFSIDPEELAQFKQGYSQHDKKFSVFFFFKMITESNYSNI